MIPDIPRKIDEFKKKPMLKTSFHVLFQWFLLLQVVL